jgi:hypothetical protein
MLVILDPDNLSAEMVTGKVLTLECALKLLEVNGLE